MTRTSAILWKEFRQVRSFSLAGLAIFLTPGIVDLIESVRYGRFATDAGEGMVLTFGCALAIFLATAVTSRDFHGPLDTFWRGRPIGAARLILVKFLVGLAALLAITLTTIVVQAVCNALLAADYGAWTRAGGRMVSLVGAHSLTLILLFSVSFLIGCLVRSAAQSAILSVAAGLLIYFLPMFVHPLSVLSVFAIMLDISSSGRMQWTPYILFGTSTIACTGLALLFALTAVGRQWRIRADMRLVYWSLCGVTVLLLGTMSVQVRPNMVLVAKSGLESIGAGPSMYVRQTRVCNGRGFVLAEQELRTRGYPGGRAFVVAPVNIIEGKAVLGRPVGLPPPSVPLYGQEFDPRIAYSAETPDHAYVLQVLGSTDRNRRTTQEGVRLVAVQLTGDPEPNVAHVLDLPELSGEAMLNLSQRGKRLFVLKRPWMQGNWLLLTLDLSRPGEPKVADTRELGRLTWGSLNGEDLSQEIVIPMLPIPGLSAAESLRVAFELTDTPYDRKQALVGEILVRADRYGITTFKLRQEQDRAVFERIGEYRMLPIERLMSLAVESIAARGGFVYMVGRSLGSRLTVYDIHDPARPRRVGHYAAANESFLDAAPLADGRLLLAGESLCLVEPSR